VPPMKHEQPHIEDLLHPQAGTEELHPRDLSPITDIDRRTFLSLMGASISLATLAGCRRPEERIVPYVSKPEEITPGIAQHYATTMPFGTESYRLLVEAHEGRPTKIAGNPSDVSSQGATNIWANASVLNLYDPDRSRRVLNLGKESSREAFAAFWATQYAAFTASKGEGLAVLSESFASPTLERLRLEFLAAFPNATFATYEPVSDENILKASEVAFGAALEPVYEFSLADVVLSVDADFLGTETRQVENTRGFATRRKLTSEKDSMNRLYLVESRLSQTAAMADHRLALPSRLVGMYLEIVASELKHLGIDVPAKVVKDPKHDAFAKAVAKDLAAHKGRSLVVVGRQQPPAVHALALAMNIALGNFGQTVQYRPNPAAAYSSTESFSKLVGLMGERKVKALVILGGNPMYNAPANLGFKPALANVPIVAHLSPAVDETSAVATWHVPMRHYLESWGDTLDTRNIAGVVQPLIAPLYDGMNMVEVLSLLATGKDAKDFDIVRTTWKSMVGDSDAEWRKVLHNGIFTAPGSSNGSSVNAGALSTFLAGNPFPSDAPTADSLEVIFYPSPAVHDGRFANNGWLQEFPDPVTKITWDNVAMIGQATADALGVQSKDLVRISVGGRDVGLPAWIVPGMAFGTVAVALGYGRAAAGRVGNGVGANAYSIRNSMAPFMDFGATVSRIRGAADIACVQDHHGLDREKMAREGIQKRLPQIFREATLDEYRRHPEFAKERVEMPPLRSMWDEHSYTEGRQWGMSIDLNACTGCGACTIACQSENNIPIVGKKQVLNGREMHWIRVDRYYSGTDAEPNVHVQPVACMQCEMAPCEQVCPVAATSHDEEGLNGMTYNRCIGTRYCSNNCPYKARRFNFFNYTSEMPETVQMAQNPDVTVRFRGVMEKCTFCVQRISQARIVAKREGREIADGEIRTACEESCPAQAIVFGNINDPNSKVAGVKKLNRDYALLGELNLRPRLTYLAKVRNPNPELGGNG
jgi:Fe-S-cluster-containing dehydrogenase component